MNSHTSSLIVVWLTLTLTSPLCSFKQGYRLLAKSVSFVKCLSMLNSSNVIMRTLAFLPNPLIAIGSNSVLGGLNVICTAIAAICAACMACMDIN